MAVLKGPLFSLAASGQIAKTLVFGSWKGIKTVRQHVTPANPQTADQTTQRDLMADIVSAWKNYFTFAEGRAAWDRSALNDSRTMSGFNMFASQAIRMKAVTDDASFTKFAQAEAGNTVSFTVLNLDDGAAGDEAGNFEIWVGSTVSGMVLDEEVAIAGGKVTGTSDLGDVGDVVYCKIRKDSYDRSGISKLTLID